MSVPEGKRVTQRKRKTVGRPDDPDYPELLSDFVVLTGAGYPSARHGKSRSGCREQKYSAYPSGISGDEGLP